MSPSWIDSEGRDVEAEVLRGTGPHGNVEWECVSLTVDGDPSDDEDLRNEACDRAAEAANVFARSEEWRSW